MWRILSVVALLAIASAGCSRRTSPYTTTDSYYDAYGNPYGYSQAPYTSVQQIIDVPQDAVLALYSNGQWTGKTLELSDEYSVCRDPAWSNPAAYQSKGPLEIRVWDGVTDPYIVGYLVYGYTAADTYDARGVIPATCGQPQTFY